MDEMIIGIVTYNPSIERVKAQLDAAVLCGLKVVIADNASGNLKEIKELLKGYEGNILIELEENGGLGTALNRIFTYASENGIKYVLTFDQDSEWDATFISRMERYLGKIPKTAIYCGNLNEKGAVKKKKKKRKLGSRFFCITAGSVNLVEAWEKCGGFTEELFIDLVDYDYCFKLTEAGYRIVRVENAFFTNEIGSNLNEKRFLFFKIHIRDHAPFRYYYMYRNYIYVKRKHCKAKGIRKLRIMYMTEAIKLLLFENNKKEKLQNVRRGIKDGRGMV